MVKRPGTRKPQERGSESTGPKDGRTRVFLIDDHSIVRDGLRRLLENQEDLLVSGEAESSKEALTLLSKVPTDLVLVDISLPGANGVELIKSLRVRFPKLLILVLSMHDEVLYAQRTLRAGARGYIMKSHTADDLIKAVRTVLKGQIYVSSSFSAQLVQSMVIRNSRALQGLEKLSDRELEIFELIGQSLGTGEISRRLGISSKTVESHRGHMRSKLGLKSGAELSRFCAANRDCN